MSKPEVFMHHGYLVTATKHMCKMYPGGTLYVRLADHEAAMAELEQENEEVKALLNGSVLDIKALCPECKSNWLLRHCKDKPYMHEYEAERNELLGLLQMATDALAGALIEKGIDPNTHAGMQKLNAALERHKC